MSKVWFTKDACKDGWVCTYEGKQLGFYPNYLFIILREPKLPFLLWRSEMMRLAKQNIEVNQMVTDEQIKFIVDTISDPDSEHTWGEIRTMIKKIWCEDIEEEMIERIYYKYKEKGVK